MDRYDANLFARAWLSVALASGKDKGRPQLNRTVNIETFEDGVRLVATDGLILLYSFVPTIEEEGIATDPGLDAAPIRTATAIDHHGRALSLMAHLNTTTVADDEDRKRAQVRIEFDVAAPEHVGQLDGMEAECLALEHPDHERVVLSTYDGEYPHWRKLVEGFTPRRTEAVAINPELVARLARLGKYHGGALIWRWGGVKKPAGIEIDNGDPFVGGLVMPVLVPALEGERLREVEEDQ